MISSFKVRNGAQPSRQKHIATTHRNNALQHAEMHCNTHYVRNGAQLFSSPDYEKLKMELWKQS